MANLLILNQPYVSVGLNTPFTYTVPSAGLYYFSVDASVPSAISTGEGAGSGGSIPGTTYPAVTSSVTFTVTQNGTTEYTSTAFTPTQSEQKFKVNLNCATSDALVLNVSSSNANDALLNTVKLKVAVAQGYGT
jgi:hypothetical protein